MPNNIHHIPLPKWIKPTKYEELSGVTPDQIRSMRRSGVIAEGVHWIIAPNGKMMVNWREMDNWMEQGYEKASGH